MTVPHMKTLRADLAMAGIPNKDEAGRYVDFHGLHVSLNSPLTTKGCRSGFPGADDAHAFLGSAGAAWRLASPAQGATMRVRGPVQHACVGWARSSW